MTTGNSTHDESGQAGERLEFVVLVDLPEGHGAVVEDYEDKMLDLLPRHGGLLERRMRTEDGRMEVHLLSFASREGYAAFLADPERAALRDEVKDVELTNQVFQVREVQRHR
ncbi:MAG TPA: hypothetical protein VGX23_34545 [Actinocrinis sp.]|nr:hypothetical protein [Actinocrinis sp.]